MKTIVAAFHPSSPSELHQGLLHRQDIRLFMVHSLPELIDRLSKGADLCLIGPQLADCGAATASQALRNLRRVSPPLASNSASFLRNSASNRLT